VRYQFQSAEAEMPSRSDDPAEMSRDIAWWGSSVH
jgi:hypothetical protein